MRKTSGSTGLVAALWFVFQVAACGSPVKPDYEPPVEKPPAELPAPDTVLTITGVSDLVAGRTATLRGRNLDRLNSLRVDGANIPFERLDVDSARFIMPAGAPCDVDGRAVEIVANSATAFRGPLSVENAIRLEIGQSRILSAEDLACVQLAAGAEQYALAAASYTPARIEEHLLRLRSVGGANGHGTASKPVDGFSSFTEGDQHVASIRKQQPVSVDEGVNALVPFDDYANAQVGDVLSFVDWADPRILSAESRDDVPTYETAVIAVTEGQLIVADMRLENIDAFAQAEVRERFRRAAELADAYALPAIRRTIDPNATVPGGAGGRVVTIVTKLNGISGAANFSDFENRRWSSNTFTTLLASRLVGAPPGSIAATIIHEMAHLADGISGMKGTAPSAGWFSEALAVFTQDMAARMSAGSESPFSRDHQSGGQNTIGSRIAPRVSIIADKHSPWGPPGSSIGAAGIGSYDRGARLIRHVAEKLGLAGFAGGPTLYQRLQARSPTYESGGFEAWLKAWGIEALAAEAAMSVEQLLEESMVADLTDDLLPAVAVATYNVPQTTSWDRTPDPRGISDYDVLSDRLIDRTADFDHVVALPAGSFAYWYIQGDGGLSFQGIDIEMRPYHQVRLIRMK